MADYRHLARTHPEIRDYLRNRRWARRGDVTAYAPDVSGACFSTDARGFRRSRFAGRHHGAEAAFSGQPWAMVLGASDVFGWGLPDDGDTVPSRLADRMGLPVLNLSFPEADARTLVAVMTRMATSAPCPPAFAVLMLGGSISRYAFSRHCDPLFGPPDFAHAPTDGPGPGSPAEVAAFEAFRAFLGYWSSHAAHVAAAAGTRLILAFGATVFTKTTPRGPGLSAAERAARLAEASPGTEARFATQALREPMGQQATPELARSLGLPCADWTGAELDFLDEFHMTAASCARVADRLAAAAAAPGG